MNTRRTVARRVGEEIADEGATPQGNRVPPQVKDAVNDQVSVNHPTMMNGEARAALFQNAQDIIYYTLEMNSVKLEFRICYMS